VFFNNQVFAVGGETHIQDYCNSTVDHNVGEQTVAVDNVEAYSPSQNEWSILWSLPNHKFRFSAVAYMTMIYTFGGQAAFQVDCQCFETTNEIVAYSEESVSSRAGRSGVLVAVIVAVLTNVMM